MFDFPENLTFHIGKYVSDLVDWLTVNCSGFFDAIKSGLLWLLINFNDFLVWVPWWFFILTIFLLACQYKSVTSGIVFAVFLFLIGIFGYWDMTMFTLAIVVASVVISLIIGIPLGVLMAYNKRFEIIAKPLLDAMQTMPTFVYLIPAIFFFGLGLVPGVLSTIIYALPPVMRLTNLAIRGVPDEVVEAGLSFGSSKWQLLKKVQIPQALPTIMAGINQTTMMALAMVVVASMVGVEGLGLEVLTALNQIDVAKGFEAGLSIVFLAIIIDRLTLAISEKSQRRI
ncbi:choline ABC transporter permease subunit [Virgibacillus phasianinus]|uniref:Choline ABC transporter permease subunit n=2 Tax=Virgibacillus phasianinus TaxID=2017483 RepID=A0A220U7C0_9BACI|nr:proline/glycine betaine ABC transporter permease [Virgibacillus phasianinus]ASK64000.1 choline ABC transporter permease subunit [Virgibacillus phasianinus]